ncbi:hypothetical protein JG688_00002549 [Phytophthora aleatoria]|uniref:Uncharacterized protein n=1 Tax=Phytophthora aleatoria TaxID=2496075 RepID=A0A8J5MIP9_9STRA|nr:hypothetical protein JG688_00002549 [Phytophthora aleatoria]
MTMVLQAVSVRLPDRCILVLKVKRVTVQSKHTITKSDHSHASSTSTFRFVNTIVAVADLALKQNQHADRRHPKSARSFAAQDSSTARVSFSTLADRTHPQQAAP